MKHMMLVLLVAGWIGCSDDSSTTDSKPTVDQQVADSLTTTDTGVADHSVADHSIADQAPVLDRGPVALEDTCPPTGPPVTADVTLSGTTSVKYPTSICSSTPYAKVVALTLTQQRKVQLTVTSPASLTVLAVWDTCTTSKGCKAGEAKSGMVYEVTRDPGTYYIIAGTSSPNTLSLQIKLLAP